MSLIAKIIDKENINQAIDSVEKNEGSKTPGVDKLTIDYIIDNKSKVVDKINEVLSAGTYKPSPIRRVEIPKGEGETRTLGIPTIFDRVVQQAIKQVLEPKLEKKFHNHSYGFRPGRSTENAMAHCMLLVNKGQFHYVVDIDIKGFFDNINHNKLIKQLYKIGIKERKILSIMKEILRSQTVLKSGELCNNTKGTPQGGIISPLLANVVLNELDWRIHSMWDGFKTKKKYKKKNSKVLHLRKKTNLLEVKIIRYADDFKLFCKSRESAEILFKLTKKFLKERLKLDISPKKSKIVNLKKKRSIFLGIEIKAIRNKKKRTCRSHISDKAKKEILKKIQNEINRLEKWRNKEQALKFNSIILGIQNYYRMSTMVSIDFNKIGYEVSKMLRRKFGKGSFTKDENYKTRYRGYNYKVWNVRGVTLYTLQACKFKIPYMYSAKNNLKTEKIVSNNDYPKEKVVENRKITFTETSTEMRAKIMIERGSKCEVTGEYLKGNNNFYVHWLVSKEEGGKEELENLMLLKSNFKEMIQKDDASEYFINNVNYDKILKSISKKR